MLGVSLLLPDPAPNAPIIVTGRAPAVGGGAAFAPVVIDRDRLILNASGRIETILGDVAGFQSFRRSDSRSTNPTAQGTALRGLGGNATSRVLMLLDGVPQLDPFFGSVPFNAIGPGELGAVRVTRGAAGGAFGLGGVAGAVELDSAGPDTLGLASADIAIGSRESISAHAILAPRWDSGFGTISVRTDSGAGFQTTPASQRVAATVPASYANGSIRARVVTKLAGGEVEASTRWFDDRRELRFAGATNSSNGLDSSLRWVRRGDWTIDLLGYAQRRDFSTVVVSSSSFRPVLNQRATPSTGLGARAEIKSPAWHGISLRLGADARRSAGTTYEDSLAASGAVTSERQAGGRQIDLGAYAELDLLRGPLTATFGGRVDRWRDFDGHIAIVSPTFAPISMSRPAERSGWLPTGRAGLRWQAARPIALRLAAYSSARLPTLNELYRTFTVFPVTTLANPDLDPERLRGAEAGIDLAPARAVTLSATVFTNRLAGAIANVTIGRNQRQRRNVDALASRGIELDARWRFPHGSLAASWTATHARLRTSGALDGKRPAQTPATAGSVTLTLDPTATIALSGTLRRTGAGFEDDLNIDRLAPATTIDAAARWTASPHIAVELRGENLANARVITRNQAGSMDLGTPRTLWLALVLR